MTTNHRTKLYAVTQDTLSYKYLKSFLHERLPDPRCAVFLLNSLYKLLSVGLHPGCTAESPGGVVSDSRAQDTFLTIPSETLQVGCRHPEDLKLPQVTVTGSQGLKQHFSK